MFMLVGALANETGIAHSAFASMRTWLARVRGGLLYTVIASNAVFAACSGLSVAGNIVFGKLSMPELKKAGYEESNSLGLITASGALSTLIPPSVGIIMFCLIAPMSMSVGTALMGGIIPGVVTALMLAGTVRIVGILKKGSIPLEKEPKVPIKARLYSLRLLIPILCLFGIIVGGTFAGFFTATVGGAIGAVAVTLYALFKKIPLKRIFGALWEAANMESGIFPIIIGGQIFGSFIAATGIANYLSEAIVKVDAPAFGIFMLVVVLYIICGCVMDMISTIIITVPIVFPVLTALGYSPYVLVIVLCFMCEIAGLTPPLGMNVFAVSNALRINPTVIFKGVLPYFICEIGIVVLIALFPNIVLWLPNMLGVGSVGG
jgi:tripartite ATP-independent transporter DctM subunit